ncbi:early nodulin-20 [Amborella trichopoda]|uniref:Uncharacterized protein n=1 Tax=Amborella trichopoda TaxID=13333 RepID=U5D157_AMBTC|nr:early nodulin-20 [Amborella trichopoda]ERN15980.1 hypothetical protein AMTR_s00175p00063170 [Amborella trichopoda]|eukprot:XP_006854513.1 early nodulin-20 [Amborella trichopoda]
MAKLIRASCFFLIFMAFSTISLCAEPFQSPVEAPSPNHFPKGPSPASLPSPASPPENPPARSPSAPSPGIQNSPAPSPGNQNSPAPTPDPNAADVQKRADQGQNGNNASSGGLNPGQKAGIAFGVIIGAQSWG